MLMKVRERIRKSWKRKGWKYSAAGFLCLTAAVCVFALGVGSRAEAASLQDLEQDSEGRYQITSADEFELLRNTNQTGNFVLTQDITLAKIITGAQADFSGTFDGNGHVITIESVEIESTASELKVGDKGTSVSEGILFGTISGTVQNLIVDIKGDAAYKRTSNAGVSAGKETIVEQESGEADYKDGIFSEINPGEDDAYAAIDDYETVYLNGNGEEVSEETSGASAYKKTEKTKKEKTVKEYEANDAGEDSFGIVCGSLTGTGRLQQVLVNGQVLSVSQAVAETAIMDTETSTPFYHYYKIGETEDEENKVNAGTVEFKGPDIYSSDKVTSDEAANEAVGKLFELQVSAQSLVLVDDEIVYTIQIKPVTQVSLKPVTITADAEGTWSGGEESADGKSVTLDSFENSVTFTAQAANVGDQKAVFTAVTSDQTGQSVQAQAEAAVTVLDKESNSDSVSNAAVAEDVLKLSVSYPKTVKLENGTASWKYTATVQNKSGVLMKNVEITYPSNVTPVGAGASAGIRIDAANRTVTIPELANEAETTIEFIGKSSAAETISADFSASATLGEPEQRVETELASTSVLVWEETVQEQSVSDETATLKLRVSAPENVGSNGTGGTITYKVTVTPMKGKTPKNVKITAASSVGSSGTGKWTSDDITEPVVGDAFTIDTLREAKTLTYTCSGVTAGNPFSKTFSAVSDGTQDNKQAKAVVSTRVHDTSEVTVSSEGADKTLSLSVTYPQSCSSEDQRHYRVTITNNGDTAINGVTLTYPEGLTPVLSGDSGWTDNTQPGKLTYNSNIAAGATSGEIRFNVESSVTGSFSVTATDVTDAATVSLPSIVVWDPTAQATPQYYTGENQLTSAYAVDGQEGSIKVTASVELVISDEGKVQIQYRMEVLNQSSSSIKKVTITPSVHEKGNWTPTNESIIQKPNNGAVKIESINAGDKVNLSYICEPESAATGEYDADEEFTVTKSGEAGNPLKISFANTKVYDTSNTKVSASNPGTAADQLTLTSSVAKNHIVSAGNGELPYTVTVEAPAGSEVGLTAVPSSSSGITGTWSDEDLTVDPNDSSKATITGTGEAKTYTYTCTIPENHTGDIGVSFSAVAENQSLAVKTEEISSKISQGSPIGESKENQKIPEEILKLQASAASILSKTADTVDTVDVVYELKITKPEGEEITVSAMNESGNPLSGRWGMTEAEAAGEASSYKVTNEAAESTIYFIRSVDASSLTNGEKMSVSASFQAELKDAEYTARTGKTAAVTTWIYAHDPDIAVAGSEDDNDMLSASLKVDSRYVIQGSAVAYTLELANSSEYPLHVTSDLTGWTYEDKEITAAGSGIRIEPGEKAELTKTVTISSADDKSVSADVAANRFLTTYEYEKERSKTGSSSSVDTAGEIHYAGNTLYAGGLVGQNQGSIEQCSQNINVKGTAFAESENAILTFGGEENALSMAVGGAVGYSSEDIADLYIKGTVSAEGSAEAKDGYAAGTGTGKLQTSIITKASDVLELGMTAESVKMGADAVPEDDWGNWKKFEYAEDSGSMRDSFDLGWLVKDGENVFRYNIQDKSVKVEVESPLTGKSFTSCRSVYQARKQLADAEAQRYFSDTKLLELGDSGYYRNLHTYVSDGFYHYVQDYGENSPMMYPYNSNKKQEFTAGSPWKILRDETSLTDQIVMTLHSEVVGTDIEIYYNNGEEKAVIEDFDVFFPFDESEVQITAVPVWNGKIYEEIISESFDESDREPLPDPEAEVTGYYTANGGAKSEKFAPGMVYQAGSVLNLTSVLDGCSYEIGFSPNAPVSDLWDGAVWSKDADAYPVWTTDADKINADWTAYIDAVSIPEELRGEQYLYVKIAKENYPDTVYCLGNFTADAEASGSPQMYYDYDESTKTGTKVPEGSRIAEGDMLVFEISPSARLTDLEYVLSGTALSGTALYGAEWKTYEGPVKLERPSPGLACYLYTRMKDESEGEVSYGPVSSYEYTFAGDNTGIQISPRTVPAETEQEKGTAIPSGTSVYLDSMDEGVKILYLVNRTLSDGIQLERVSGSAAGLTEDGKHFKAGERWYRTSQEGVQIFEEQLILYNDQSTTEVQYVHAAVLGTDFEPGESLNYVYQVEPTEQTSAPEATLATQNFPNGADTAVAEVEKDTYLSFTSLTPGAELYYVLGNGTVADHEDTETGTKKYDASTGIQVEGDYGSQFTVSIKAVKWNEDGTKKELKDSETIRFVYLISDQQNALAPTSTPATSADAPSVVLPGEKILLSTATRGASIFYTTDGTEPRVEELEDGTWQAADTGTKLYDAGVGISMPSEGSGYFTVGAVAVKPELGKSPVATFIYAFPSTVQSPYTNIPSGSVDMGTEILLKNRTEGASIYYTVAVDGKTPEDPTISSAVFDEAQPIIVNGETSVKAMAVKDGVKSEIVSFKFNTMDQLAAPEASISSGAMVSRGTKLTLNAAEGASIYYTMDGSDPSEAGNAAAIAGKELTLDGEPGGQVTVKAYARMDGKSASEVVTFTYQISRNATGVTADVKSGSLVSNGSKVNLMTDVTDAEIYYTTDGSDPTDDGIKGTVVTINGVSGSTFTIKAVAVVDGNDGMIATFTYKIKEKPTAPTASPSGGVLTIATRVELSSSADKIYYTTDGTTPTESSSLYKEPILINRTTQLQAIAVSEDGEVSDVASFQYTAAQKADTPTASHEDDTVLEPGTIVALSTDTMEAAIYYSTDGTDPTLDNLEDMLEYTEEGITVNRTVTIKAVSYREDMQLSSVGTFNYIVEKIPAVEKKAAEEEKLAAEGLHETDASGLEREENPDGTAYQSRVLREKENNTVVSSAWSAIPNDAVLVAEKTDHTSAALDNVKQVFGEDYEILSTYDIYLMQGGTMVQPEGEVELGIPIPEEYLDAAVTIVYIDSDNKITKQETRRKDGMAYAMVSHFSRYALVGLEDESGEQNAIDYLLILECAAGLAAFLGIIYAVRQKWKRFRRDS